MRLLLRHCTLFLSNNTVHASSYINKMSVDIAAIGAQKVKGLPNGASVELKSFWQDQDTAIIFFRRWGCMLCRLWAKELAEIAPVLKKHDIKLIGVGVEEANSKEFIDGKYFDGDLYCVEDLSTYQNLGFKRFNTFSIITSLFWKQSRDAIFKGKGMGLGGDLKGDWVQTGGALLVKKGGEVVKHFVQSGPGDHYPNKDILKAFGLEHEYNPDTMANQKPEENACKNTPSSHYSPALNTPRSPIHFVCPVDPDGVAQKQNLNYWKERLRSIWVERRCNRRPDSTRY